MTSFLNNPSPIILILAFCLSPFFTVADTPDVVIADFTCVKADPPGKKKRKKRKKRRKSMYAQPDRLFTGGQWDATLSIGTIPTFVMDGAAIKMLPVQLGMEYRFGEKFSIGAVAGHSSSQSQPMYIPSSSDDGFNVSWTNRFYHIALRPAVHLTSIEKWDFYGGFSAGIQVSNIKGEGIDNKVLLNDIEEHRGIGSKTNGALSGFAGLRYVVSPKWTVGGEVGFGVSIFTVGVTHMINKVADK